MGGGLRRNVTLLGQAFLLQDGTGQARTPSAKTSGNRESSCLLLVLLVWLPVLLLLLSILFLMFVLVLVWGWCWRGTHVNVVQDEVHAMSAPPVGHGVLGLVVQLHHPPLVKHDFAHVLRIRPDKKVDLGQGGGKRGGEVF